MGWSNSWGNLENSPEFIKKVDEEFDKQFGVYVDLSIPIKDQWPRKVRAIQVGYLAVHEQLPNSGMALYKWQVTHVPTLTMFDRAIPDGDWTQEQLVKWCWKVQQETDLFQAICMFDNSNYKTIPKGFIEALQDHCLSILPGD